MSVTVVKDDSGREHSIPGPFVSIEDIKSANAANGQYWFSPQSLKFFSSKIENKVYGGRLFITSEQFESSDGHKDPRRWSIRLTEDDGSIWTINGFQEYASKALAEVAVLELLEGES